MNFSFKVTIDQINSMKFSEDLRSMNLDAVTTDGMHVDVTLNLSDPYVVEDFGEYYILKVKK